MKYVLKLISNGLSMFLGHDLIIVNSHSGCKLFNLTPTGNWLKGFCCVSEW